YERDCEQPDAPSRNAIVQWSIIATKKRNDVLIGTFGGLFYADTSGHCLIPYRKYNDFQKLANSTIYHLSQKGKYIWAATTSGLYKIDEEKGVLAHYNKNGEGIYKLPADNLLFVHETNDGKLWLGSRGNGCFL